MEKNLLVKLIVLLTIKNFFELLVSQNEIDKAAEKADKEN